MLYKFSKIPEGKKAHPETIGGCHPDDAPYRADVQNVLDNGGEIVSAVSVGMEIHIDGTKWSESDRVVKNMSLLISDLLDGEQSYTVYEFRKGEGPGEWVA